MSLKQENRWNGDVNVITASAVVRPDQRVNEIRQGAENITIDIPSVPAMLAHGDVVPLLFFVGATGAGTITFRIGGTIIYQADPGLRAFSVVDPTNAMETAKDFILFTYYYGRVLTRTDELNA
jgi:hypothetical protein